MSDASIIQNMKRNMSPYIKKALDIDQDLETDIQLYIVYSPARRGGRC